MNGIFFRNKELSKFMNDGGSIVGQVCPLSSTPNERNWVLLPFNIQLHHLCFWICSWFYAICYHIEEEKNYRYGCTFKIHS